MSTRLPRSRPEWLTFGVSAGVVMAMVALIAVQAVGTFEPAAPTADRVGETREIGERFVVDVEVTNRGDEPAQNVQVVGSIIEDDEVVESGDQFIDFLAGGETVLLSFVFDRDPDATGPGEDVTQFSVTSYATP